MDVAVLQPLDDLYDVMIYPSSHPLNIAARERIERQHPETEKWPERVDAFLTRDITSAKPWEKITAVQGGFLVARPDAGEMLSVFWFCICTWTRMNRTFHFVNCTCFY